MARFTRSQHRATGKTVTPEDLDREHQAVEAMLRSIPDPDVLELVAVPKTGTSPGVFGQAALEDGWLYVCFATNRWQRIHASNF